MDAAQIEQIRESLRHLLRTSKAADLPQALCAADWPELLEVEPAIAIGVLAEEQGRALAATPALDLVLLHGAGLPVDATSAFVLPPMRRGAAVSAVEAASGLRIDGLVLGGARRAARLIGIAGQGLVAVPAPALELERIGGFDPDLGLCRARGEVTPAQVTPVAAAQAWTGALGAGRRSLAAELVGVAERMLADTVEYVIARKQFGRALGSFQAVKHRLADVRVALGAARAGLVAAWDSGDPISAIAAKCLAARAHRLASTHCHQVLGGIAFTTEHGFHRFIQRGHLLDALLGPADEGVRELGRHLIDTGVVPRVPRLRAHPVEA